MFLLRTNLHSGVLGILFTLIGLCGSPSSGIAQVDNVPPKRTDPVAQDPAGRKPPPPDDPSEHDVAQRQRFRWELTSGTRMGWGFYAPGYLKEAGDSIPVAEKQELLRRVSMVLVDPLHPRGPERVQWYGNWGTYANPDALHGVDRRLDLIVAEWSIDGYTVSVSRARDSDSLFLFFRIGFSKRPELKLRHMPADFTVESGQQWQSVSKASIRDVLVELFGWPASPDDELGLYGHIKTCAGIDVFVGRLRPWRRKKSDSQQKTGSIIESAVRPDRILITDSDPQYLCMSFYLRSGDPNRR